MKALLLSAFLLAGPANSATYTYEYVSQPLEFQDWKAWNEFSEYEEPSFDTDEEAEEYYRKREEEIANLPRYDNPITYRFVINEAKQPERTLAEATLNFQCRWEYAVGSVCKGQDGAVFDEISSSENFGTFVAWDYGYLKFGSDKSVVGFSRDADDDPGWTYSWFSQESGGNDAHSVYFRSKVTQPLMLSYGSSKPGTWTVSMTPSPVPIPAGWALLLGSGLMLGFLKRRTNHKAPA